MIKSDISTNARCPTHCILVKRIRERGACSSQLVGAECNVTKDDADHASKQDMPEEQILQDIAGDTSQS